MKIVGVFNRFGYNVLKDRDFESPWPTELSVIYQSDDEKYYIEFLYSGDILVLLTKFQHIKDNLNRELELQAFIKGKESITGYPNYGALVNKFAYEQISLANSLGSYSPLSDFKEGSVIMETNYKTDLESYNRAVMYPNKKLYIGSREFIFENSTNELSIENKSAEEIEGIIYTLIQLNYLEEAKEIINKLKLTSTNLDEYKHPKYLMVFDGSNNFLDEQMNRIEAMNFVKEKTKSMGLYVFRT
jgi:hypothetical protein